MRKTYSKYKIRSKIGNFKK